MRLKFTDLSNILNHYYIIIDENLYIITGIRDNSRKRIIIWVAEHLVDRRRTVFYCLDITKERMLT